MGYHGCLESCTAIEAELKSLVTGIKLAAGRQYPCVMVEMDSAEAVTLVQYRCLENHRFKYWIEECKQVLVNTDYTLHFAPRETNRCAYILAKREAREESNLEILATPTTNIEDVLFEEMDKRAFEICPLSNYQKEKKTNSAKDLYY